MSINHQIKTMIHEYAHIQLHKDTNKKKNKKKSKQNQLLLSFAIVLDWIQANILLVISHHGAKE